MATDRNSRLMNLANKGGSASPAPKEAPAEQNPDAPAGGQTGAGDKAQPVTPLTILGYVARMLQYLVQLDPRFAQITKAFLDNVTQMAQKLYNVPAGGEQKPAAPAPAPANPAPPANTGGV
ncbi:MAG: hypothetical protein WC449_05540 [Candidatus Paceibacterota bacterium]